MKTIHLISQLSINENGLQTKTKNGRYQSFFFQQGDLDGACVIYSALMSLIIVQAVSYKDVAIGGKSGDGRTRIERLKKELFEAKGMHRDGNYLFHHHMDSLEEMVRRSYSKKVSSKSGVINSREDLLEINKQLEINLPVIVSLDFSRNWAHAVLVIGMQLDGKGNLEKFFILDPSCSAPRNTYWNGVLELNVGTETYPDIYYPSHGEYEKCNLEDWLVFIRN